MTLSAEERAARVKYCTCGAVITGNGKTGLCSSCAQIARTAAKERPADVWMQTEGGAWRRRSACHPDRPALGEGLCAQCHHLKRWPEIRARANARKLELKQMRAEAEGRVWKPRPPKGALSKTCKACGKQMKTSERTYCSPECKAKAPKNPGRPCVQCGGVRPAGTKGRATCSDKCAVARMQAVAEAQSQVGCRSEAYRAARRREGKTAYKGKDKQELLRRMSEQQHGKCMVCTVRVERLVLDHCHKTGDPRAALCVRCNAALGMVKESPEIARRLAMYAEGCIEIRARNC